MIDFSSGVTLFCIGIIIALLGLAFLFWKSKSKGNENNNPNASTSTSSNSSTSDKNEASADTSGTSASNNNNDQAHLQWSGNPHKEGFRNDFNNQYKEVAFPDYLQNYSGPVIDLKEASGFKLTGTVNKFNWINKDCNVKFVFDSKLHLKFIVKSMALSIKEGKLYDGNYRLVPISGNDINPFDIKNARLVLSPRFDRDSNCLFLDLSIETRKNSICSYNVGHLETQRFKEDIDFPFYLEIMGGNSKHTPKVEVVVTDPSKK